jgi:amidophosphoribosyltransferase
MPSRKELVAHGRDDDEIAAAIGADVVIFQTLPDLIDSVRQLRPAIANFDCSVFTGQYVTGDVDEEYLQHLEGLRSDNNRFKTVKFNPEAVEEKGIGGANGVAHEPEIKTGADAPAVHGSDDTVGLHNSWHTHS